MVFFIIQKDLNELETAMNEKEVSQKNIEIKVIKAEIFLYLFLILMENL